MSPEREQVTYYIFCGTLWFATHHLFGVYTFVSFRFVSLTMSEFDFEAYCGANNNTDALAVCALQKDVEGVTTGVDTFWLIFAVSGCGKWRACLDSNV